MKQSIKFLVLSVLLFSCENELTLPVKEAYQPVDVDAKAGTWKTYILKKPDEIIVAKPGALTTKEYIAEIEQVKTLADSVTAKDKEIIKYWSAGAVYRWNEIARQLVAKYNVPVKPNEDGSYPIANPNLPTENPPFPDANALYTARMLALLSVAQYDALVANWHYKYKFNRPNPYVVDDGVPTLLSKTEIPSFPSEDASVAAASIKILGQMFPAEVKFLEAKAFEAGKARLQAGMNVFSDMLAGSILGDAVAQKVLAYANTDGMADANKQAVLAEQRENAQSLGIKTLWESAENPQRPAMLPNFGTLKTWNFNATILKSIRPTLPFLPESPQWKEELAQLQMLKKNLTVAQKNLANYWSAGSFTHTIAGQWHKICIEEAFNANFSEVRMARSMALLGTALHDAAVASWDVKFLYHAPRPQQFGLQRLVDLPNYPSFTSLHSAIASAAAAVMSGLFPSKSSDFGKLARDASDARLYGLVNFLSDCDMGLTHGNKVGSYALIRAENDNSGLTISTK
jgi:membrane-associated phospholipid phosphatase